MSESAPKIGSNPFLFDTVLEQIMSEVDIEELKKFRFVCKFWDKKSLQILSGKELRPISLYRGKDRSVYNNAKNSNKSRNIPSGKIPQFLQKTRKISHVLRNFDFSQNQIRALKSRDFFGIYQPTYLTIRINRWKNRSVDFNEVTSFLGGISRKVKKLEIQDARKCCSKKYFQDNYKCNVKEWNIANFEMKFPILDQITLEFANRTKEHNDKSGIYEIFTLILSQTTPNLRSIISNSIGSPIVQKFEDLAQKSNGIWSTFKELKLGAWQDTSNDPTPINLLKSLIQFGQKGMCLTSLSIGFGFFPEHEPEWRDTCRNIVIFLKTQANSLEFLEIDTGITINLDPAHWNPNEIPMIHLPLLKSLKSLKFYSSGYIKLGRKSFDNFLPFDFSELFPALNHLSFGSKTRQEFSTLLESFKKTRNHPLRELRINEYYSEMCTCCNKYTPLNLNWTGLFLSFPRVESFGCWFYNLPKNGQEIPWKGLKSLRIVEGFEMIKLDISHLKNLEVIIFEDILYHGRNWFKNRLADLIPFPDLPNLKSIHFIQDDNIEYIYQLSGEILADLEQIFPVKFAFYSEPQNSMN